MTDIRRSNKILAAALLASVMGNMFFIGHMAGRQPHPPGPPFMRMEAAAQDLPADQQKIIMDARTKYFGPPQDMKDGMYDALMELRAVLTAPEYKPEALAQVHARLAHEDATMKTKMVESTAEIAGKLTPEARITFFDRLLPPEKDKKDATE